MDEAIRVWTIQCVTLKLTIRASSMKQQQKETDLIATGQEYCKLFVEEMDYILLLVWQRNLGRQGTPPSERRGPKYLHGIWEP